MCWRQTKGLNGEAAQEALLRNGGKYGKPYRHCSWTEEILGLRTC